MKPISTETTETKGKTAVRMTEPKSFDKISSDVSEQLRRLSPKTQKILLADLAQVIGKKSPKDTANRSITIQTHDKHEPLYSLGQKIPL